MSSPESSPQSNGAGNSPVAGQHRRAQLAAIGALVLLFFLFWFGLSMVANDPVGLVISFVSVFLIVFSAWIVLIRKSLLRFLVLPLAFVAVQVLITYGYDQKYQLLVLIPMLVAFGFASRYAMRKQGTSAHTTHRHARAATPARNGVLIINPRSGGGKAERFNLLEEASKRSVEPIVLELGDDLTQLATRAVSRGADVIGMAGGDGSQALVATVAMDHDVAHVCIPSGTRNHFALDLGLDRNDVVGALDAFTDGVERRIDLARLNDRVFVNNASLGVYARVVQSDAYREAKLGTWKRMLPEMVGGEATECGLQFEAPNERDWCDAALVIVSNNPYQMRRFRGMGSRPLLDSGRLGIFAARLSSAGGAAKLVTLGIVGAHRRFGGVLQWSSLEFEVQSEAPVSVGLDGEALVLVPPLRFVSLPGALRIRVPRHARGASPAAAAVPLTRRNLGALVRIAAGKPVQPPTQRHLD